MAKYSKTELVDFIANSQELDNEAKAQLIKMIRENVTYGLIWERNQEEANEFLRSNLPILNECQSKQVISKVGASDHILIEADNLHALASLCYTHEGKFDAIYIDPPYNTGARDWKYNNDYVDNNDAYRHSKWLTLMENRLRIAKKLLNPEDSVLILTIDDNEYLHIGCLLEQMFPGCKMTMVSSVINPSGKAKKGGVDFSRTDEYIYFVQIGNSIVLPETREITKTPIAWETFRRHSLANGRGKHGVGACGPNQFYPIYVDDRTKKIVSIGEPIHESVDRFTVPSIEGCTTVFPVRDDGTEMNWGGVREEALNRLAKGYMRVGKYSPGKPQPYSIQYLTSGTIKAIERGEVILEKPSEDGSVNGYFPEGKPKVPTTNWNKQTHNATSYGTDILTTIIGPSKFDYPKSLYAVKDCLNLFIANKPNALILDFFAGSGTTLHATMLLNQEDGGSRRCFLVTNNENNICEDVTYERNKRVILGYTTPKGELVEGLGNNNLRYFKTNFFPRSLNHQSKKQLFYALADTIRIKENCYTESKRFGSLNLDGKEKLVRYFDEGYSRVLMVYDSIVIPYVVNEIKTMTLKEEKIKIYIFCDGVYPYTEDFKDVISSVDLIPMPGAMLQALKYVLPQENEISLGELDLTKEEIKKELEEAERMENDKLL